MKLSLRSVPALLLAALLALPGIGSESGPGATGGGTGVWILPTPKYVASVTTSPSTIGPASASFAMPSLGSGVTVTAAADLGEVNAVLIDEVSGSPVPLVVSGRDVAIDREVLQGLLNSGTFAAYIVITDANLLGYVLKLAIDPATSSATLTLR